MYALCTQALVEAAGPMARIPSNDGSGRYWARTSDLRLVEAEAAGMARNAKAQKGSTYADPGSLAPPAAPPRNHPDVRTVYAGDLRLAKPKTAIMAADRSSSVPGDFRSQFQRIHRLDASKSGVRRDSRSARSGVVVASTNEIRRMVG